MVSETATCISNDIEYVNNVKSLIQGRLIAYRITKHVVEDVLLCLKQLPVFLMTLSMSTMSSHYTRETDRL